MWSTPGHKGLEKKKKKKIPHRPRSVARELIPVDAGEGETQFS